MDLISALGTMRNGEVVIDADRKFRELLGAVLETGKKGRLTLTVEIKPSKFAMGGTVVEVETSTDCNVKKPELTLGRSLFFVADGILTRDDPAQVAMFAEEKKETKRG